MEQIEKEKSTKGDLAFSIIERIIEGLHHDTDGLVIEVNNLLMDTSSGIHVQGLTGIIILESDIKRKLGRVNVLVKGLVAGKPDVSVPFSMVCSIKDNDPSQWFDPDSLSVRSFGKSYLNYFHSTPMELSDTVYSLDAYKADSFGSRKPIGSGRGFMIFDKCKETIID